MDRIIASKIKSKAEKQRGKSAKERDGSDVSSADDSDASAEATSRKKKTDDRWKRDELLTRNLDDSDDSDVRAPT